MKKVVTEIFDENGSSVKEVKAIVVYQDGIVVGTSRGLYTNVKSLLKENKIKKIKI